MATITSENNPTLHARLLAKVQAQTVGWERPSNIMIGGQQYIVQELADQTFQFAEVNSELMHDSTSDFPGRTP